PRITGENMLFVGGSLPSFPFDNFQELDGIEIKLRLLAQAAFPDMTFRSNAVIAGRLFGFAFFGEAETYKSISLKLISSSSS
ncbi:MAG: hypothetical protein WCD70_14480, partial [Alphaproteobacteria bacterium]